jgi:hypothetical protein
VIAGDEGKEPSRRWSRVWERRWVSRDTTCGNANLGDEGDEGKGPSHRWSRVWERRWVSRDATWECKQILATRVTKAKSHHRWGRVCGSGDGCREMQQEVQILATRATKAKIHHRWSRVWERWCVSRGATGCANLGDGGDEGKGPSSLRPCAAGDDTGVGSEVLADSEIW